MAIEPQQSEWLVGKSQPDAVANSYFMHLLSPIEEDAALGHSARNREVLVGRDHALGETSFLLDSLVGLANHELKPPGPDR